MEFIQPIISDAELKLYWFYPTTRSIGTQTEENIIDIEDYRQKLRSYCKRKYKTDIENIK